MSIIDPEKLERALRFAEENWDESEGTRSVIAAARAHLATLPRFKEVEVEAWVALHPTGNAWTVHASEASATQSALHTDWTVVRLTGTAKVKVKP